jgi:hypothetical protein
MPEINNPPCPTHGAFPRALHPENFEGIVTVIEEIITTVSGLGTTSYSRCPNGYPWNFEGAVRALEDLNTSISGLTNTAVAIISGVAGGNGVTVTASGSTAVISTNLRGEGLVDFGYNAGVGVISGITNTVLSGQNSNVTYSGIYTVVDAIIPSGLGGASVTVSGAPGDNYRAGDLWFDTNQGRLFVYASGNGVTSPDWYQTNADAIVSKGDAPPSGTGTNAPPREGSMWFSTLLGSLFVYDATTSGWYEAGPSRSFIYDAATPPPTVQGAGWYSTSDSTLKVWDGTAWISV